MAGLEILATFFPKIAELQGRAAGISEQARRGILGLEDPETRGEERTRRAGEIKSLVGDFGAETAQELGSGLLSEVPALQQQAVARLEDLQQRRAGQEFANQAIQAPLTTAQQATLDVNKRNTAFSNLTAAVERRSSAINEIGDDVRKTMAPVTEIIQAGADIENLLASGTVLGGTAAAIRFAKASDPESSVREGELGTIIASLGGLEQEWVNAWNRAINEPLSERTQTDLVKTTRALISQRALDGLSQIEGFGVLGAGATIPADQMQAIFQTARVNIPEMVKFAMPAMSDEQKLLWADRLENGQ